MTTPTVLDLYAGPGGWDTGLRAIAPDLHAATLGVEVDPDARHTRRLAGHHTHPTRDVYALTPPDQLTGLIASPPCTGLSKAGTKAGRADLDDVEALLDAYTAGNPEEAREAALWTVAHPGTLHLAEPFRIILTSSPTWVALEQVPEALPAWDAYADRLRALGYDAVTAVVDAADYGTPQRRDRAVLLAHRDRPLALPPATHGPAAGRPYATMADALDLPDDALVNTGRDWKKGGTRDDAQELPVTRPAPAMTGKSPSQWHIVTHDNGRRTRRHMTMAEAGVIQGFPAAYPWHGTAATQGQQVGNAVPPPLAAALLGALVLTHADGCDLDHDCTCPAANVLGSTY